MILFYHHILVIIFVLFAFAGSMGLIWRAYRAHKKFAEGNLARNSEGSITSLRYQGIALLCLVVSMALLSVAVLRPQWGIKSVTQESHGADVMFVLDVSKSMNAHDIDVDGNVMARLQFAKATIQSVVEDQLGNRYGLVVFAGDAFVVSPLTLDHSAFLTFLSGVGNKDVTKGGTSVNEALRAALGRFDPQSEEGRGKVVVLMTDGGDEDELASLGELKDLAEQEGIRIVVVGVGTEKGAPIVAGEDMFGRAKYMEYKGEVVIPKLNNDLLKQTAQELGGTYYQSESSQDLSKIVHHIDNLDLSTMKKDVMSGRGEQYAVFLIPSLLFFLVFIGLTFKISLRSRSRKI